MSSAKEYPSLQNKLKVVKDWPFFTTLIVLSSIYILLLLATTLADFKFANMASVHRFYQDPYIIASLKLSILSCSITTILCMIVAIPLGYLMSRFHFFGKSILDIFLDIPIMLPPIVVGIGLTILFNTEAYLGIEKFLQSLFPKLDIKINPTFTVAGVILAQFMVSCAFAIRTMRTTYDEISHRQEHVALTLGCSKGQAFINVILPQTKRGIIAAATIAWARSLGEFGPLLIFAGTTRMKTEVLSTTVYLEFQNGNLEMATTVSILMVVTASIILFIMRTFGQTPNQSLKGE